MHCFWSGHSLENFAATHGSGHNPFDAERCLTSQDVCVAATAALTECRALGAS